MKETRFLIPLLMAVPALIFSCSGDDETRFFGDMDPVIGEGKADSVTLRGIPVSVEGSSTQAWDVKNQWEDTGTEAARKAGIAWPADSGLNWDEKYRLWIESMEKTESHSGYGDTFLVKTPWGREIPAPVLECAEVAMFLRATFASWYNLPFYMQAYSGGQIVYLGHFGWRTKNGKFGGSPNFKSAYKDYSYMTREDIAARGWPSDPRLRGRKLYGADDDYQPFIGEDARAGAYFDEIFLNKRAGYFLLLLLTNFGSINLADPSNLYNIKPEAVQEGDVLLERWSSRGIGHTLIVKSVRELAYGKLEAELASGSMPRRQPKWEDAASSKYYFTLDKTGGEGTNYDGEEYARLGGGIKRWRAVKQDAGYWVNTLMQSDVDIWISSTNYEDISARPAKFDEILGQMSPEEEREILLGRIQEARDHLMNYPASCAARINREAAFTDLYELCQEHFGMTVKEADSLYRILDDYVFAELEYNLSKTCCWNATTNAMYEIIMDYNTDLVESGDPFSCLYPVVFKNSGSSYEPFRGYAYETDRGGQWVEWSEGEPCPQRGVENDTETGHLWTDFCEIKDEVLANTTSE
jgi:hypothetical protein